MKNFVYSRRQEVKAGVKEKEKSKLQICLDMNNFFGADFHSRA